MAASTWPDHLRRLWEPQERLTGSAWAERYRVLPRKGHAEPGRLDLDRTPYVREILNKLNDDTTREVGLVSGAQVGKSETAKSAIASWIDQDSADCLLVLPNESAAKEHLSERITPMLAEPRLARWVTDRSYDLRKSQVTLLNCSVYLGWSGSPQSLASRSLPRAVFDETDKGQDFAREAATIDLIRDRLLTYPDESKLFVLSTPTTKDGPIWQFWLATADKRKWHCPCLHCGALAELSWEQVRWDQKGEEDEEKLLLIADQLLSGELSAWYECASCGGRIDDSQRLELVQQGEWISCLDNPEASVRIAYQVTALCSPWVSFARTVVEFIRGKVNRDLRNFYNSFLGLPHQEGTNKADTKILRERAKAHRAFVVPRWCTVVTAGADTQAKAGSPYWYWVVRAWGPRMKSRLIAWGKARSVDELKAATIDARFPLQGGGPTMTPLVLVVDSGGGAKLEHEHAPDGSTTQLVYRMAREDPARIIPVKGASHAQDRLIRSSNVDYLPPGAPPSQVLLHTLDTESMKDQIAALIKETDPVLWQESSAADDTYLAHMDAEEKTRVRIGRKFQLKWLNNTRKRCDLWDATVYSYAGAHMLRAEYRRERGEEIKAQQESIAEQRQPGRPTRPTSGGGFVRRRDGFIKKRNR